MAANYLVISYDSDQQQSFCDVVWAETTREANERVSTCRPEAVVATVLDVEDMEGLLAIMSLPEPEGCCRLDNGCTCEGCANQVRSALGVSE